MRVKKAEIDMVVKKNLRNKERKEIKVLVINGATREDGNTDVAIENFNDGLKRGGCVIHTVCLRETRIANCIGCGKCAKESKCSHSDDMTKIRKMIVKSDVLVFASPLYFCEVTGLMKTFLDRLYFFYQPENKHFVSGKKALVLTTMGEKEVGIETEVLEEFYKRFFHALGISLVDMVFFTDLMEKGEIRLRTDYLEKAYYAGRSLPIRLKKRERIERIHSFS
jgi:multimeric flavodoxin WrbA